MSEQYSGPPANETKRDGKARAKGEKAYRKAQRPWYKKKRFLIPLILVLIIALAGAFAGGDDEPGNEGTTSQNDPPAAADPTTEDAPAETEDAPADTEAEPTSEPEEQAIEVSAQEMIEVLEGNALNAKNTYEDTRVTVSGFVGSIDASGNYFSLDPEPDALIFTGIQVQTSEEFLDQVASFSAGQEVTVTGTVTDVGELIGYNIEAETIEE